MKLLVKDLIKELLEQHRPDDEVKIVRAFADDIDDVVEMDIFDSGYTDDGTFQIKVIEWL